MAKLNGVDVIFWISNLFIEYITETFLLVIVFSHQINFYNSHYQIYSSIF